MNVSMYFCPWLVLLLLSGMACHAGKQTAKYQVHGTDWINGEYFLLDAKGDTIKKLEKHKYSISFGGDFEKFAVFGIKGRGWCAIDIHENILFEVANFPIQEPLSPDHLVEGMIRITDDSGMYGFANDKGKIVIKPQFEVVTQFNNGHAIFGQNCRKEYWDHDEEAERTHDPVCEHYSILCTHYGYINKKGKIIKIGEYTFEAIQSEIGWNPPE